MRWAVVALVGYLLIGLELGLREFLRLGPTASAPYFVVPLVVFIALFAQPISAMWAALLLGLVIDLMSSGGGSIVAGPHALGYALAVYVVVAVRSMMMRRNPLTLMVLSIVGAAAAQAVVVTIFTIRSIYPDPFAWQGMRELTERMTSSLYTGATGLVLALVLFPMMPLFGFHDPRTARPLGRRP